MNVNETAILKKLVNGERESATHTKYAPEKTRPGTQVRDLAHEFGGMSVLLGRVGIVGSSYGLYPVGNQFPLLSFALRRYQRAAHTNGCSCIEPLHLGVVRH